MVSLPAKWARAHNIKKGDEVEIEEDGNVLKISTEGGERCERASIDVADLQPMVKRILGALYKAGYSEMEISFSTPKELELIQEVIREEFIGFEITEHRKNSIIAKEVTKTVVEEFDRVLNRMFFIIKQMGIDSEEAIKKMDHQQLEAIALRDKDINKLTDFCRRILNQKVLKGKRNPPMYFIVEQLEKVSDMYRDICQLKIKPETQMMQLFSDANRYFSSFIDLYQDFNLTKMAAFAQERYRLRKIYQNSKTKYPPFLMLTSSMIESIFDMNGPVMANKF